MQHIMLLLDMKSTQPSPYQLALVQVRSSGSLPRLSPCTEPPPYFDKLFLSATTASTTSNRKERKEWLQLTGKDSPRSAWVSTPTCFDCLAQGLHNRSAARFQQKTTRSGRRTKPLPRNSSKSNPSNFEQPHVHANSSLHEIPQRKGVDSLPVSFLRIFSFKSVGDPNNQKSPGSCTASRSWNEQQSRSVVGLPRLS